MSEVLIGAALEAFFTVAFEKAIAAAQLGSGDDTRPPGIGLQEPASSAVRRHLEMVGAWSEFVQFKDLPKPRRLHEIFVDLDLQLTPRHLSLARTGESKCASIQDLVNIDRNFVLLGDVGAGKTTSMKRLVRATLGRFTQTQAGPCPVLFLLRDLDDQQCLADGS